MRVINLNSVGLWQLIIIWTEIIIWQKCFNYRHSRSLVVIEGISDNQKLQIQTLLRFQNCPKMCDIQNSATSDWPLSWPKTRRSSRRNFLPQTGSNSTRSACQLGPSRETGRPAVSSSAAGRTRPAFPTTTETEGANAASIRYILLISNNAVTMARSSAQIRAAEPIRSVKVFHLTLQEMWKMNRAQFNVLLILYF